VRRAIFYSFIAIALSLFSVAPQVSAQDATPASDLAALGLPTLDVTVSMNGYEGIPAQIEAGRYLVNLTIGDDLMEGGGIGFVQPPEGMSAAEFQSALAGPPAESGAAETSPVAVESSSDQAMASPAAEAGGPPEFIFAATFAGGIFIGPGESDEVVVDLGPGEWIAWADDPEAGIPSVTFEVTGEMPTDLPEPSASATVTMAEYTIAVTEGTISAGPQIVRVDNVGAQPHFILWELLPPGTTPEQIQGFLDADMAAMMTGTPAPAGDFNPEEVTSVAGTGTQSMGTSIWITVDVPAGTNGMICFFPDLGDGLPHAFHGMYTVIEVPA
jgi:hypothetical protein